MSNIKTEYAMELIWRMQQLAEVAEACPNLEAEYFDAGYGSGGANEITEEDLETVGCTVAELTSLITVCQQVHKLLNNQATAQGDYSVNLNRIKRCQTSTRPNRR